MTAATSNSLNPRTSLWAAALFFLLLLLVYRETALSMVAIWSRSDTFAHGFLILPISLWLVWNRRDYLVNVKPAPAPLVALLLVPGSLVWLLAWLVDVLVVQQLALVGMLVVGIWSILGHRLAWALAFPLFFLFFAVPMGEGLIAPMMDFTAVSTVWLIQLTGIPVFREGLFFTLPTGRWSIVEACSGVRYIIASVTVGALFAYLTYVTWWRRALFLLISAIVPVFANTMRAYIIVMLGHMSDMKIATGADHLVYGWVFFGVVIFLLFWLGSFFREEPETVEKFARREASGAGVAAPRSHLVRAVCFALLAAALVPLAARYFEVGTSQPAPAAVSMPQAAGNWNSLQEAPWAWQPVSMVGGVRRSQYTRDADVVSLELQYPDGEFEQGEIIGSGSLFTVYESSWKVLERSRVPVESHGSGFVVEEAFVRGNGEELIAWSWYLLGDLQTASDYVGKLQQARASLGLALPGATRVVLVTPMQATAEDSRSVLRDFLEEHGSAIVANVQRAYATSAQ